jgi:probable rRNA maturation factor
MIQMDIINNAKEFVLDDTIIETANRVVEKVFEIEAVINEGEVSLLLVSEEEIKSLNNEYRGKDEVTDVLSFPQYDDFVKAVETEAYLLVGDVVICVERMREQAEEFGHSIEREFAYLLVHSLYHLMGYDHMDPQEKIVMRLKEETALESIGLIR